MKALGLAGMLLLTGFTWQEDSPRDLERRMAELKAEHAAVQQRLKEAKTAGDTEVAEELSARLRAIQDEMARFKDPLRHQEKKAPDMAGIEREMQDLRAKLEAARAAGDEGAVRKIEARMRELEMARHRPPPGPPGPGKFPPPDRRPEFDKQRLILRERFPDRADMVERLMREGRFDEAQRIMDECMAELRAHDDLKERDPEAFKQMQEIQVLERETEDLGSKLRRTPAANKEAREELRQALNKSVSKLFDLREKMRAREVEELRRRLEQLTETLKKRQEAKERIVERRVKQLAGEPDEYDW